MVYGGGHDEHLMMRGWKCEEQTAPFRVKDVGCWDEQTCLAVLPRSIDAPRLAATLV